MPDAFKLGEGLEVEQVDERRGSRPVIDPAALGVPFGSFVTEFMRNSAVYDDAEKLVKDILYTEVIVPTSDKYECAARFIPGATIGGKVGPVLRRKVLILGKMPSYEHVHLSTSEGADLGLVTTNKLDMLLGVGKGILLGAFKEAGLTGQAISEFYVTNLIRFPRIDGGVKKTTPTEWVKECRHFLQQELHLIQPDIILTLGTDASKALTKLPVKKAQGRVFDVQITDTKIAKVICACDPKTVLDKFENRPELMAAVQLFHRVVNGENTDSRREKNFYFVDNETELSTIVDTLVESGVTKFAVDCEWGGGQHYLDPKAKLRTVQIAWSGQDALVVVLHRQGMKEAFTPYISSAVQHVRRLLCRPDVKVMGHNLAADFGWLYEYGVDLSGQFYFDTMLASHLFEPTASHDLDTLVVKSISGWGRHDSEVQEWITKNKDLMGSGQAFANIPDELLHPYGANDACATFLMWEYYESKLSMEQHTGYSRLFRNLVMPATLAFIEIERNGVAMDLERLVQMEEQYRAKYEELLEKFRALIGRPYFNPNSSKQKVDLLYGELGLDPVKTTGKYPKMWEEVIDEGKQHLYAPAVDDETLGMLASKSPVAKALQDVCLISTVRKSFLTPKVLNKKTGQINFKKGLIGFIKRDGRLHPQISQMVKTGRLAAHDPNLLNMPNQSEAAIQAAGGGGIYKIRSAFLAEPGNLIVSADYKQAEVATLAYLSGDPTLVAAIEAGEDIHSAVAVRMFKLPCTVEEVKKKYKALRVAAKSLVFGIIYGRGRKAVRREIEKAGVPCTDDEAQEFIDTFMAQFPLVKLFIENTQKQAEEHFAVETLWHRRELFYKVEGDKGDIAARQKRQSVNFKIQSYCADLLRLALINLHSHRQHQQMKFKLILTVHDSIMLEVPYQEVVEVADNVFPLCMTTNAKAPGIGFTIGCDVDVVERWDEKMYLADMLSIGLPEDFSLKFCAMDDTGQPKRKEEQHA
jgi:uracil-DNA glycosylase family 4